MTEQYPCPPDYPPSKALVNGSSARLNIRFNALFGVWL